MLYVFDKNDSAGTRIGKLFGLLVMLGVVLSIAAAVGTVVSSCK